MFSECNCIKNNELEDGNCICIDCNCHSFRQNDLEKDKEKDEEWLQNKLRNYGIVILGTSTIFYGIYLFCCEKHLHYLQI